MDCLISSARSSSNVSPSDAEIGKELSDCEPHQDSLNKRGDEFELSYVESEVSAKSPISTRSSLFQTPFPQKKRLNCFVEGELSLSDSGIISESIGTQSPAFAKPFPKKNRICSPASNKEVSCKPDMTSQSKSHSRFSLKNNVGLNMSDISYLQSSINGETTDESHILTPKKPFTRSCQKKNFKTNEEVVTSPFANNKLKNLSYEKSLILIAGQLDSTVSSPYRLPFRAKCVSNNKPTIDLTYIESTDQDKSLDSIDLAVATMFKCRRSARKKKLASENVSFQNESVEFGKNGDSCEESLALPVGSKTSKSIFNTKPNELVMPDITYEEEQAQEEALTGGDQHKENFCQKQFKPKGSRRNSSLNLLEYERSLPSDIETNDSISDCNPAFTNKERIIETEVTFENGASSISSKEGLEKTLETGESNLSNLGGVEIAQSIDNHSNCEASIRNELNDSILKKMRESLDFSIKITKHAISPREKSLGVDPPLLNTDENLIGEDSFELTIPHERQSLVDVNQENILGNSVVSSAPTAIVVQEVTTSIDNKNQDENYSNASPLATPAFPTENEIIEDQESSNFSLPASTEQGSQLIKTAPKILNKSQHYSERNSINNKSWREDGKSFYDHVPLSSTVMALNDNTVESTPGNRFDEESNSQKNENAFNGEIQDSIPKEETFLPNGIKSRFTQKERILKTGITYCDSKNDVLTSTEGNLSASLPSNEAVFCQKNRCMPLNISFDNTAAHSTSPLLNLPFKSTKRIVSPSLTFAEDTANGINPAEDKSGSEKKNTQVKSLEAKFCRRYRPDADANLTYLESEESSVQNLSDSSLKEESNDLTELTSEDETDASSSSELQENSMNRRKDDLEESNTELDVEGLHSEIKLSLEPTTDVKDVSCYDIVINTSTQKDEVETHPAMSDALPMRITRSMRKESTLSEKTLLETSRNVSLARESNTASGGNILVADGGSKRSKKRSLTLSNNLKESTCNNSKLIKSERETPLREKGFRRQVRNQFLNNVSLTFMDSSCLSEKNSLVEDEKDESSLNANDESAEDQNEEDRGTPPDSSDESRQELSKTNDETVVCQKENDVSILSTNGITHLEYSQPSVAKGSINDGKTEIARLSVMSMDFPLIEPRAVNVEKIINPLLRAMGSLSFPPLNLEVMDTHRKDLLSWRNQVEADTKPLQEVRESLLNVAVKNIIQTKKRKWSSKQSTVMKQKRMKINLQKPAPWANYKLYHFLKLRLQPQFGIQTNVKAEEIVGKLYRAVNLIIKSKDHEKAVIDELKVFLAHHNIVRTTLDFYHFIRKFLPYDFENKVVPSVQPFSNIIWPPNNGNKRDSDPIL